MVVDLESGGTAAAVKSMEGMGFVNKITRRKAETKSISIAGLASLRAEASNSKSSPIPISLLILIPASVTRLGSLSATGQYALPQPTVSASPPRRPSFGPRRRTACARRIQRLVGNVLYNFSCPAKLLMTVRCIG